MYGQLGHGSNNHEILPRQVMELMGSVVTQVRIISKKKEVEIVILRQVYSSIDAKDNFSFVTQYRYLAEGGTCWLWFLREAGFTRGDWEEPVS